MAGSGVAFGLFALLALALPVGLYLLVRDESERNRTRMDWGVPERAARRDGDEER